MAMDFKKTQKQFYLPGKKPELVDVPEMVFLMVDGRGDPNVSPDYQAAVEALYGLSYTIRMKKDWPGYVEYVVAPLEGLWDVADGSFRGEGQPIADKSLLSFTALIRQPDFVTPEIFAQAKEILARKKPELDTAKLRLETYREGLCAQVMHIGPYDDEPKSVAALAEFIKSSGYEPDFEGMRRHHEIYLSDPRKTAPEKLKTVLRHPIRKKG